MISCGTMVNLDDNGLIAANPAPLPAGENHGCLPLRKIGLTRRECEVLLWVCRGKRDAEIAGILGVATKTVSKHVEHILAKLGASNRTVASNVARARLSVLPTNDLL